MAENLNKTTYSFFSFFADLPIAREKIGVANCRAIESRGTWLRRNSEARLPHLRRGPTSGGKKKIFASPSPPFNFHEDGKSRALEGPSLVLNI